MAVEMATRTNCPLKCLFIVNWFVCFTITPPQEQKETMFLCWSDAKLPTDAGGIDPSLVMIVL